MLDCKLYIAVVLFILLFFINKDEPFITDDITDNVLLETNGKTVGDNANTNSIKKNNQMVNQINIYDRQNDVVLKSVNECIAGESILQKNFELINKNFNLLTNPNQGINSKDSADQNAKIAALSELLQRLQQSLNRTNDAINKNNYNINGSLKTTFTNFRAGWFNGFDHGTLNNDRDRGGWGMADNCVRDRMTRTAMAETYDKGFKKPGYNNKCFNVGGSRNCQWNWNWGSFRWEESCSTTSGRNLYSSLYNKYNNNYDLTTYALQRPVSQVNFIRFLEFFVDLNNWNGNPNIVDDSWWWWWGYGLQGNRTPHKNFSMNYPFGIANIDPNTANINSLNMKFSDKNITFTMNGEHIIQGL